MIKVYFDGACWPNPNGPCHFGFVIYREGKVLVKDWKKVGEGKGMSNNVGEFAGLCAAMQWLIEHGYAKERAICFGDSKLVIKLMKGKWHCRGGRYEQYYLTARQLKWKLPNISFKWIPRECNTEADRLSKKGLKINGSHPRAERVGSAGWKETPDSGEEPDIQEFHKKESGGSGTPVADGRGERHREVYREVPGQDDE